MAFVFRMRTDGREPQAEFTSESAGVVRTYALYDGDDEANPVPKEQIYLWVRQILGTTSPGPATGPVGAPGGAGSLVRVMPMPDPMYPSLFAERLTVRINASENYRGNAFVLGGVPLAVPLVVDRYADYLGVEFDVASAAQPYTLLPNSRMVAQLLDFYEIDGTRRRLTAYPEWLRFTQRFGHAIDSRVSAAVAGGMVFRAPGQPPQPPRVGPGPPDGEMITQIPDMLVNDIGIKYRWFGVPRRYVESQNSYLARYRGFINQLPFSPCTGATWAPGTLLYLNCETLRTYTPPQFSTANNPAGITAGSFAAEALCDYELSFILTFRQRGQRAYAQGDFTNDPNAIPNVERPNNSWIDGGHNWLPHFNTKQFHYAHVKTTDPTDYANWRPYYQSAPIPQILFQDPDVPGQVVVI